MELILWALNIYTLVLIGRALLSWFDPGFNTQIGQILYKLTEPVVGPVRQVMPRTGMIDISIMVTVILCIILQRLIESTL